MQGLWSYRSGREHARGPLGRRSRCGWGGWGGVEGMGGIEALQSCVVSRGLGVGPAALVEEKALAKAIHERQRLSRPAEKIARLKWIAANEAGLGRSEGLACLLVTLKMEGTSPGGKAGTMKLLAIWSQLYAQLAS